MPEKISRNKRFMKIPGVVADEIAVFKSVFRVLRDHKISHNITQLRSLKTKLRDKK
jgi:hypothetical protein